MRHDHRKWNGQAATLVNGWQPERDPSPVFDQALALPVGWKVVNAYATHVSHTRADVVQVLGALTQRCLSAAARSRAAVVERLKQQLDELVAEARKKLEAAADLLVERGEVLRDELRRAGKTPGEATG